MGMTIEFYAAHPQELTDLIAQEQKNEEEEDVFFKQLEAYPVADFSLHLWIPEDLDSLCRSVQKQNPAVSPVFRDHLVEQLWFDGQVESLTLLSESFTTALAHLSEHEVEQAASDWNAPFSYGEPLQQTPGYQAFLRLTKIARIAIVQKKSLMLYVLGTPAFFRW